MPIPPPEAELAALNREIEHLETEQAMLEEQRKKRGKVVSRANWRLRYLNVAARLRTLAGRLPQGRLTILIVVPAVIAVLMFILGDMITGSGGLAFLCLLVGAGATAGVLWAFFNRPADELLPAAIAEADSQARVSNAHFKEVFERLTEVKNRLQQLVEERRAKMASGRVQRAALLQRPWKGMTASEWEDFVVEVCRTLGATAERLGRLENGAELVVDFGSRRVATIVKTAREPIDSEAVRQAISIRDREHCDTCSIITNGRFTGAAQDYGPRQGCKLIGREEFPDFVLGQVEW